MIAVQFKDYGDDCEVTYAEVSQRLRAAFAAFPDDQTQIAWHYGDDFTLEHVSITFWMPDGNNFAEVEVIPFFASVQITPWNKCEISARGLSVAALSAAKDIAETISMDVSKGLEVLAKDFDVDYFEAGPSSRIETEKRREAAQRDSVDFLKHLMPSSVGAHAIGSAEVAAIRTVALTLLGELATIDPEDLAPHLDDGQRAVISGFWRMLTPAVPDPDKSIAAFDALEQFRLARQEVCS